MRRQVLAVVAVQVVRVGRVRAVGGHDASTPPWPAGGPPAPPPRREHEPLEDRPEEGPDAPRVVDRCRPPRGRTARRPGAPSRVEAAAMASTAAQHDARLSMPGRGESSPSRPSRAGGVRSCVMRSHHTMAPGSAPSSAARTRRSRPARAPPRPQIGVSSVCWSRARPLFTSRSRWMASCGDPEERARRRRTQLDGRGALAAPHGHPPRDAEVAVEPRVVERPAVDLDAELA